MSTARSSVVYVIDTVCFRCSCNRYSCLHPGSALPTDQTIGDRINIAHTIQDFIHTHARRVNTSYLQLPTTQHDGADALCAGCVELLNAAHIETDVGLAPNYSCPGGWKRRRITL